jgi:Bacterial SH3 domain
MMRRGLLLLAIFGLMFSTVRAQEASCSLAPRLQAGAWAYDASDSANNLRAEPGLGGQRIGRIPAGDIFRVLDGSQCVDGYVWWRVNYDGMEGWTAEGDAASGDYWLEAVPDSGAGDSAETIAGCEKPPEIYNRIQINYATLNLRTLAMLDHTQALYTAAGGILHFRDAIMQGSYNPGGVSASFGTHDGGGAVDLSVRNPQTRSVETQEIPLMIHALRLAGFAAWLRSPDELYKGSPIHIHAIAIGDAELSDAARGQIDGTFGYLRGYNGLPQDSSIPLPDTSGEIVVCNWMMDMGYHDMR